MKVKNFRRWSDKNETVRAFMNLMRELDIEVQCEIAIDIILKATPLIDRDYENIIKDVANFDPKDFKRWYDKNPNIHLAIESLRDLEQEQQEKIVQEFCDKILNDSQKNQINEDLKNILNSEIEERMEKIEQ